MKKNFERCLNIILAHEGGYVYHPSDPGGATNRGVTLATYEQWVGRAVTKDEIKALTNEDVAPIYEKNYWSKLKCDSDLVPAGLDLCLFDCGVNSGTGRSAKALQRVLGATADGAIGPKTLAMVPDHDPKDLIEKIYEALQHFYKNLSTFATFGKGWTRRNKETLEIALRML